MSELINKARNFAIEQHTRINHLRKYTKQPYHNHLKAVADIVSDVTNDEVLIAAAWLHDVVEDTEVTHSEIEDTFGKEVAQVVYELTDKSTLEDGNRAIRKKKDRDNLRVASQSAKLVKLADLMDNTDDICRNSAKFAEVYLPEVVALLNVIKDGNEKLAGILEKKIEKWTIKLNIDLSKKAKESPLDKFRVLKPERHEFLTNLVNIIKASQISDPFSFEVKDSFHGIKKGEEFVSYIIDGHEHDIRPDQILKPKANIAEIIITLSQHSECFIEFGKGRYGVITKSSIEKPLVRMWLFGIISFSEEMLAEQITKAYPGDTWINLLPKDRLEQAQQIQKQRESMGQNSDLVSCLQLSDKARVALSDDQKLQNYGFESRKDAKRRMKTMESLRNNVVHQQPITIYDWPQIIRITNTIYYLVTKRKPS
jgi:hypothetical protein